MHQAPPSASGRTNPARVPPQQTKKAASASNVTTQHAVAQTPRPPQHAYSASNLTPSKQQAGEMRWWWGARHLVMMPIPQAKLQQPLRPRKVHRNVRPAPTQTAVPKPQPPSPVRPKPRDRLEEEVRAQQEELDRLRQQAAKEKQRIQQQLAQHKQRQLEEMRNVKKAQSPPPVRNTSGYGMFMAGPSRPAQPQRARSQSFDMNERGQPGFSVASTNESSAPSSVLDLQSKSGSNAFSRPAPRSPMPSVRSSGLRERAKEEVTVVFSDSSDTSFWHKLRGEKTQRNKGQEVPKERKVYDHKELKAMAEKNAREEEEERKWKEDEKRKEAGTNKEAEEELKVIAEKNAREEDRKEEKSWKEDDLETIKEGQQEPKAIAGVVPDDEIPPPTVTSIVPIEPQSTPPEASPARSQDRPSFFDQVRSKDIVLNEDEAELQNKSKKRASLFSIAKKDKPKKNAVVVAPTPIGLNLETKPYLTIWEPEADVLSGPRIYKLKKKEAIIGTDKPCQVCVEDASIGKRQAQICIENGVFVVRDLDPQVCRARVNGQTIPDGKFTILQAGDVLALGKTKIVVCNNRVDKPTRFLPEDRASPKRVSVVSPAPAASTLESIEGEPTREADVTNEESQAAVEDGDEQEYNEHEQGGMDEQYSFGEEYTIDYNDQSYSEAYDDGELEGERRVDENALASLAATLAGLGLPPRT